MLAALRGTGVFALVVVMTIVLMPAQIAGTRFRWRLAEEVPLLWHRIASRLMRVRVEVRGTLETARPVLFVSNHVSWLDIIVMGKVFPACFIAKSEVAGWPFFGRLAKLQRSVFVERSRHATASQRDVLQGRLEAGDRLILFPEGSSGDGIHLLPFKSGFLSVAEREVDGTPLVVQPVTIVYIRVHGLPILRRDMHRLAWYGEMSLLPHFWRILTGGPVTAEVRLHEAVTIQAFGSRKALTRHCQQAIGQGLSDGLSGRPHQASGAA